ncbi:endonuclease/exonuclease/phosphatase family protein [Aliikangiella sp. IMCC44359]|uniref:endonuclease/exonuclease/phosphatase family protein n=1 Tax=Aliikangiella sp. IMCC44359 TaxID=3459125 RepID=UPI00403AAB9A
MRETRSFPLIGVIELFSILTVILSLISLFPSFHWFLELTVHFKLQYLIASIIFFPIFVYARKKLAMIALGLCVCINAYFIIGLYLPQSSTETHNSKTLKLMFLNLLSTNSDYSKLVELIKQESPDIFIAQEVNDKWQEQLKQLTENYPYQFIIPRLDNFGIAILSKEPLTNTQQINWGNAGVPSLITHLHLNKQPIKIVSSHLLPPGGKQYYQLRNQQAEEMVKALLPINEPLILVGDLNMTMWSNNYHIFESNNAMYNARKGFGILATWPAIFSNFGIPIDHILLSNHFSVTNIYTGPNVGSDHLPLIAEITLRKQ